MILSFSFVGLLRCSRVKKIVSPYAASTHVELQQRAVEFSHLFGTFSDLRGGLLERMPLVEPKTLVNGEEQDSGPDLMAGGEEPSQPQTTQPEVRLP